MRLSGQLHLRTAPEAGAAPEPAAAGGGVMALKCLECDITAQYLRVRDCRAYLVPVHQPWLLLLVQRTRERRENHHEAAETCGAAERGATASDAGHYGDACTRCDQPRAALNRREYEYATDRNRS